MLKHIESTDSAFNAKRNMGILFNDSHRPIWSHPARCLNKYTLFTSSSHKYDKQLMPYEHSKQIKATPSMILAPSGVQDDGIKQGLYVDTHTAHT